MLQRFLQIYVSVLLLLQSLVLKNQLTPFCRRPKPFDVQLALRLQLSISVQSNEIEKQVAGPFLFFASRHGTLIYVGTAMYAFEGVAVLLPVEDICMMHTCCRLMLLSWMLVDNVFTCNLLIYCFNYLFLVGGQ